MTTFPQDSRPGGATPRPGPGPDAAGSPPVRVTAANPGAAAVRTDGGTRGITQRRAGGASHPLAPPALDPAPGHSGAEGGLHEPSPQAPARAPVAVPARGGQGNPSPQGREGTAGPGAPVPGPAQTSTPAVKGAAGVARDGEAGVRTLRAGLPPATEPAGGTRPSRSNTSPPAVRLPDLPVVARFTIDGEPAAKERARVVKRGPKTRGYTPEKTLHAEQVVGWKFRQAAPRHQLDAGKAYGVTALFLCGTRQRRDVDNMLKLILDGLNGVAWPDDNQVAEVSARKALTVPGNAHTEVVITEVCGGSEAA